MPKKLGSTGAKPRDVVECLRRPVSLVATVRAPVIFRQLTVLRWPQKFGERARDIRAPRGDVVEGGRPA